MRLLTVLTLLALFLPALPAQQQCLLTGEPRLVRAEGLTEPLGEVLIQCAGAAPGQLVNGVIQLAVDSRLGNRLNGGFLQGVTLSQRSGTNWLPIPVPARLSGNSVVFESLSIANDTQGQLALKISGLRAEGQKEIRAFLSFLATPALPLPNSVVTVGIGDTSLLSGFVNPSYSTLTTRLTENVASAFGGPGDLGVRVMIRFQNVPPGAAIFLPNAIAGSNAVAPTSSGAMSLSSSAGAWQSGSDTLLLARVQDTDSNGAGGSPTFTPQSGLNNLEGSGQAAWDDNGPYAVYEVLSANPTQAEFAEVPAHISLPTGWFTRFGVIRPSVSLAPISAAPGPSETLPIPRFRNVLAKTDCERLGDCSAEYYPRVVSFLNGETPAVYQLPSGQISRNQYIAVRNDFGGLAEWKVFPRYKSGDGWLRLHNTEGINNTTVAWYYDTHGLPVGRYAADLVIQVTNGPAGLSNEQIISLTLDVTPAVDPPKPEPPKPDPPKPDPIKPVITDIVNAASGIAGPIAPGSLLLIRGELFNDQSTVLIDAKPAVILQRSATELLVETPLSLNTGKYTGVMIEQDGIYSGVWGIDIVPVAPAIFHALNADDSRNSAEAPATTGGRLQLWVTGIRLAGEITVKLHDRWIETIARIEQDPPTPGIDILSFDIPDDLPAMSTAVTVCASDKKETAPRCAEPLEIFLKKP